MPRRSIEPIIQKADQVARIVARLEDFLDELDNLMSEYYSDFPPPETYSVKRQLVEESLAAIRVYAVSIRNDLETI